MENNGDVQITTYDRLLRAWENSMELTRDFEMYSKSTEDNEQAKKVFHEFAQEEGLHAAKFKEMLKEFRSTHEDRFC